MQNQINLFSETADKIHNKEAKRPARLDLSSLHPQRQKWDECKIYGKNILIRSYAGACATNQQVYVYGGLQILNGVLSDFHTLNINPKNNILEWKQVPVKDKTHSPGPRAKHALVAHNTKIYLVGGIKSSIEISNEIHVFDIETNQWALLSPKGAKLPPLETFGCVLVGNDHPKIVSICGYDGTNCALTNGIYCYDILSNSVEVLFENTGVRGTYPCPRLGCGVTSDNKSKIYIFGGKSEEDRLNDFWEFDLTSNKYTKVYQDEIFRPVVRNGHTMTFYEGKIFLFGGIHDITWELDDLHIYDIEKKQWMVLESDSARKKKENSPLLRKDTIERKDRDLDHEKEKKKATTNNGFYGKISSINHDMAEVPSPTKTTNELKHKAFLQRKTEMLKNFEVREEDKQKLISVEPSSQAMKNSLDMIGSNLVSPESPTKLRKADFAKTTYSKFMEPLVITTCFVPGKKPCARDGHNAILIDKDLVFFGGDRHHMSFNDTYLLHLDAVLNELPKH